MKVLLQHEKERQAKDTAAIAQLGMRQTEDLKVPGSIPGLGSFGDACLHCVVISAV